MPSPPVAPKPPDLRPPMVKPDSDEHVPKSLLELDQWFCWSYVMRDGNWTKVPVQPNGRAGKPNDPCTWTSFENAFAAAKRNPQLGIGFVFAEGGGLVGVDIDHCLDDAGQLKTWAQPIIERFADSYMEISPSGTGIKIFARGNLDGLVAGTGTRRPFGDGQVEVYGHCRFFTFTGRAFNGAPSKIEEHRSDLEWLVALLGIRPPAPNAPKPSAQAPAPATATDLSAEEFDRLRGILAAAQENDLRFSALFRGELCDFPSRNEADLSFCNQCASLGLNADQIDAAVRISGRMRTKWDERHFADGRTYGQATVQRALVPMEPQTPATPTDEEESDSVAKDPLAYLKRQPLLRKIGLANVRKIGRKDATYDLILADGSVIEIGHADDVLNGKHIEAAIADATTIMMLEPPKWRRIAQAIFLAGGPGEETVLEKTDETETWVRYYLSSKAVHEVNSQAADDLRGEEKVFSKNGCVYLAAEDLRKWIHITYGERYGLREMGMRLRRIGFKGGKDGRLDVKVDGKTVTRRFWKSPAGFLPAAPPPAWVTSDDD